ncbi:Uncharacterised protein [Bordetella pertussis]|nr:Uncharacterised protein [Bordetella pertussis]
MVIRRARSAISAPAHNKAPAALFSAPDAEASLRFPPATMACLLSISPCVCTSRLPGTPISVLTRNDLALTRKAPSATGRISGVSITRSRSVPRASASVALPSAWIEPVLA